ncbi:uncharacterized protein LOC118436430 [Folsomia candida]|uniref:uncharacterized protein LOC118436430 n=1 Tax=Folsomia candida TaxID=158441 RepID=UPI0016052854|nr:uncharacterized protein LOC118436430 [Folsomia candida]
MTKFGLHFVVIICILLGASASDDQHFIDSKSTPPSDSRGRGMLDKLGQIALVGFRTVTGDPCAVRKFWLIYLEINSFGGGNCANCDKYFHCRANYDAVHVCMREDPEGDLEARIRTAEEISNAREFGQHGKPDSQQDQIANRFGRRGGNCGWRYLSRNRCFYHPKSKICYQK